MVKVVIYCYIKIVKIIDCVFLFGGYIKGEMMIIIVLGMVFNISKDMWYGLFGGVMGY